MNKQRKTKQGIRSKIKNSSGKIIPPNKTNNSLLEFTFKSSLYIVIPPNG